MPKPALRAVAPNEKPTRRRTKTVIAAAASGNRGELLLALRARIARALDDPKTHPRDISPLSRRLQEIADELEAMNANANEDDIGQAAATPDEAWPAN